ncbi:MAG: hypothetical protein HKO77_10620 [Gemmatimonadetes bacterium]|nr:hypothetical protein [Gemmatimonadota bacterium]
MSTLARRRGLRGSAGFNGLTGRAVPNGLTILSGLALMACPSVVAGATPIDLVAQEPPSAGTPAPAAGAADPDWNDAVVLRLVERAREQRQSVAVDSAMTSYQARALGNVYFFVDRADSIQHVLVKGDQVALDLYWRAPNETQQWIVGRRDERVLPTSIRYHLDHLTVVQDDFGDFIRLGDGDEVEAVAHPLAPDAETIYDYALTDSLRLSYAGGQEVVRVYEISVRPKDLDAPGYVGTIFVDRDRAAVVRMNFSFTPASYVDGHLDYIRISLDNALWMASHWLPYRQEVEIRREIPYLDFMAGSTIRTTFDIRDYDFNVDIPDDRMRGRGVRAVSPNQQQAFQFEREIFAELEEAGGIGPSPTMEEVRTQVREVVEDEVLSGLSGFRLHAARLSDFARYNRAEGVFAGAGVTLRPHADLQLRTTGGYAFGRRGASGALSLSREGSGFVPTLDVYWDATGDIGGHPGATPLENTISSASGDKDYLDPFFRRGATLTLEGRPARRLSVRVAVEDHVGARDVVSGPDSEFRPVRSIEEGTIATLAATFRSGLPAGGRAALTIAGGFMNDRAFGSTSLESWWDFEDRDERWSGRVSISGAFTESGAPPQTFHLIGGRHTLPGHDYRAFGGNAYWLARMETTVPVWRPYLGVRAFAALGATYLDGVVLPADWAVTGSSDLRGSAGLGLSFGYDSMRVDVGRALWGSGWEAVFSVSPQFRSWL